VVLEAAGKLPAIAAEAGLSPAQFAIAWTLRRPEVTSAIIGASRPGQVEDNAAASGVAVDSALFAQAERLMADALAEAARLEGTDV
jgi:aryl-alcohol dehydrogenase-like predicted oxidoreductase